MKFSRYIKLEYLKIKSSYIKFTILAPIFLSLIMILTDLLLRKDVITTYYIPKINDGFQSLIVENHLLLIWPIILLFSIIINSISIFFIDTKNDSLTHLLSTQITRSKYYLSKLVVILICTIILIFLEGVLLIFMGYIFKLSTNIDIPLVIRCMWMQLFCSLGIIGFECFLFSITKKVSLLTSINIGAMCVSIFFIRNSFLSKINPYIVIKNSMPLCVPSSTIVYSIFSSFIIFLLSTIFGLIIFNHIDILGE